MPDLRLDTTEHDILLGDDLDFQLTETEDESLAQRLKVKLLTFQGEWFLDSEEGMPWISDVFGKNRSLQAINSLLQDQILEEPEVIQIVSFSSTLDNSNRVLSISFTVQSDTSDEVIPVELEL